MHVQMHETFNRYGFTNSESENYDFNAQITMYIQLVHSYTFGFHAMIPYHHTQSQVQTNNYTNNHYHMLSIKYAVSTVYNLEAIYTYSG